MIIIFLMSCNALFSQVYKKADQETIDLIKSVKDDAGKESGALIILKEYESTINEKGEAILVLRVLGKVYNSQALEAYSHVPLGYNTYYEDAVLNSARVIRKDGTTIEVRQDAVQIKTSPDYMGDTKYSDSRYLTFAFSGLEIGSAFEYKATFKQKRSVIEGEWFENHYFGGMLQNLAPPYIPRTDPVARSVYRLRVPKNYEFKYHVSVNPQDPQKRTINSQDEYTWEYIGIPALKLESRMPPLSELSPVLLISTVGDWSKIDEWSFGKLNSATQITQPFKEKVNDIIKGAVNRDEKIKSILAYIRKNIRYVYADLDRGGYEPHKIMEVLNSLYGDCKDQAMLLVSMLKVAGIEAYPVLVNPYPEDELTDLPAPFFTHLITCIPSEKDTTWVDMTSRVCDYSELPAADQYRNAFIVNGKGGSIVTTPGTPSRNVSSFDIICRLSRKDAVMSMSINASGIESEMLKSAFMNVQTEEQKDYLKSFIKNYVAEARFDSIGITDIDDQQTGFNAYIEYHLDSALNNDQPVFSLTGHSVLPLVFFSGVESGPMAEKRSNDIISAFPFIIKSSEVYDPPRDYPLNLSFPANDSMKNDFFEFRKSFSKEGNRTIVNWEFRSERTTIPKEKYNSYVAEIKKMEEMATWNITYVNPISFMEKVQSDDPRSILNECNKLLQKDRDNLFALLIKGYSFNELRMTDSSLITFARVLKIDPGNKYAHYWITRPLSTIKMNSDILSHFEKAFQSDPSFDEAYVGRGAWYLMQRQVEKGIADFKRAVEVDSSNVRAWNALGAFYSNEKKYSESIEYLRKSLRIDSVNTTAWEIIAQCYMETKAFRDAEESYKKAIDINPTDGSLYGNLGWTYYMLEDFQKCLEYSAKALSLNPTLYYVRFNVALANLRIGKPDEANKLYAALKKEKYMISPTDIAGAMEDLKELKAKGIYVEEVDKVLKSFR